MNFIKIFSRPLPSGFHCKWLSAFEKDQCQWSNLAEVCRTVYPSYCCQLLGHGRTVQALATFLQQFYKCTVYNHRTIHLSQLQAESHHRTRNEIKVVVPDGKVWPTYSWNYQHYRFLHQMLMNGQHHAPAVISPRESVRHVPIKCLWIWVQSFRPSVK